MITTIDERVEEFLDSANIIFITGEINDEMYRYVVSKLIYYAAESRNPIYLIINSIGGSVYSAYGIISVMKSIKNEIVGIANGIVSSAALVLLANCDYRYAFSGSSFMYHLPSTSVEGTDIDIEHMIEELNIIKNHEFFKNTEKLTPNSIDLTRNVDHAFTLEQAKESGLIQKVIKDFDDIVPEKYAEDIKASIVQEISTNILAVFEEYDDVEMFSEALDLVKYAIAEEKSTTHHLQRWRLAKALVDYSQPGEVNLPIGLRQTGHDTLGCCSSSRLCRAGLNSPDGQGQ